jgi:hypothetical protein
MATSTFAVNDFMTKVENLGGLARKNRFSVEITPPSSLSSRIQASTISFLAKTVSFPARSFGTTTYRSGGRFGLEVPYETTFEPVSLTMLNTNNHAPRKFWIDWLEHIQSVEAAPGHNYNMQYYKKFIGQIKISYYNETHSEAFGEDYNVILHEAWPKTISAIELGWENSELADFEIDIAYSWWTSSGAAGTAGTGTAGR